MNASHVNEHIEMERETLRLLCSVLLKPRTRVEICRLLDSSKFLEPLQRILFEEIRALGPINAKQLLQLLPARVTNRGFPDFDLQDLLSPKLVSEEQIEKLFQSALHLMDIDKSGEESVEYPA
jgi:hypothetical protein